MKVATIRAATENHLRALGFSEGSWSWVSRPNTLIILVNGKVRQVKLGSSISEKLLCWQLARIQGWAEALSYEPKPNNKRHVNGAAAHADHGVQLALLA